MEQIGTVKKDKENIYISLEHGYMMVKHFTKSGRHVHTEIIDDEPNMLMRLRMWGDDLEYTDKFKATAYEIV